MDEFAQTRGVDDLFEDDVIPVTSQHEYVDEPVIESYAETQYAETPMNHAGQTEPVAPDHIHHEAGAAQPRKRGPGRSRGRTTGFSRRLRQDTPKKATEAALPAEPTQTAHAPTASTPESAASPEETSQAQSNESVPQAHTESHATDIQQEKEANGHVQTGEVAVTDNKSKEVDVKTKEPVVQKVLAVRGDRSGTGGVKKPKLTEEELSERLAAAKINAAKKAAAHARAEADEASFLEREKIVSAKREEERQNRRAMLSEREKNRQRKLNAQTGREWDADKTPDDLADRGKGSAYRRGAHGGVVNDTRPTVKGPIGDWEAAFNAGSSERGRGRGRGGRGGRGHGQRGGPGGIRNKHDESQAGKPEVPLEIPGESEFPALPSGGKNSSQASTAPDYKSVIAMARQAPTKEKADVSLELPSPVVSGTWAEQVEVSEEMNKGNSV